ncbi:S9 family peptidase [Gelidibacter japonicus]|uniref:S9 family peptidase n=1 Tax=Gelidibacter japonicus TaxID=1962232 RepID=UPI0013D5452D|nr:prolyl oligopeptidase family serine peptidase [Gelidibacter japonicus]
MKEIKNIRKKYLKLTDIKILIFLYPAILICQNKEKKDLNPIDYYKWETLYTPKISPTGNWATYKLVDTKTNSLVLHNIKTNKRFVFPEGNRDTFSQNGKWFTCIQGRDLIVFNLLSEDKKIINGVHSYKLSNNSLNLVYLQGEEGNGKDQKAILLELNNDREYFFENVVDYEFNEKGDMLAITSHDASGNSIYLARSTNKWSSEKLIEKSPNLFKKLTWSESSDSLAFYEEIENGDNNIVHWFKSLPNILNHFIFNPNIENSSYSKFTVVNTLRTFLYISKDNERLLLSVKDKKTNYYSNPFNSKVQVWNASDRFSYAQNDTSFDQENPPILGVWNPSKQTFKKMGDKANSVCFFGDNSNYIYSHSLTWDLNPDAPIKPEVYVYDVISEKRERVLAMEQRSEIKLSPSGNFLCYFDQKDWWVYNTIKGTRINLTDGLSVNLLNEEQSRAFPMSSYGSPGWSADETEMLIYDKYDIWAITPDGKKKRKLTDGRSNNVSYRIYDMVNDFYIPSNPGDISGRGHRSYNLEKGIVLLGNSHKDLSNGYFILKDNTPLDTLIYTNNYISDLRKASSSEVYIYKEENFDKPPSLKSLNLKKKITNLLYQSNSQHYEYKWGKSELINYYTQNGNELKGALFYPANFNPEKRYPVIVFIYEIMSPHLNKYENPSLHSSGEINISNFTTQDYFVFCPDIVYKMGNPGISALECVTSGVEKLKERKYINDKRIGLYGHSFGGYQASFISTQTNMFTTVVTDAGYHDLLSSYLSMAWLWSVPQSFRYENFSMRFRDTYFNKPELYERNSPIHNITTLDTPILSITGNQDTNVNWEQSVELYNAMRILNKENIMLIYPNEGHVLMAPENQVDFNYKLFDWFGYYLKNSPKSEWMKSNKEKEF